MHVGSDVRRLDLNTKSMAYEFPHRCNGSEQMQLSRDGIVWGKTCALLCPTMQRRFCATAPFDEPAGRGAETSDHTLRRRIGFASTTLVLPALPPPLTHLKSPEWLRFRKRKQYADNNLPSKARCERKLTLSRLSIGSAIELQARSSSRRPTSPLSRKRTERPCSASPSAYYSAAHAGSDNDDVPVSVGDFGYQRPFRNAVVMAAKALCEAPLPSLLDNVSRAFGGGSCSRISPIRIQFLKRCLY